MATQANQSNESENITVVSGKLTVNNSKKVSRTRDISAEVEIIDSVVKAINNGVVREKENQAQTAGFSQYANSQLNMSFMRENNREDEMSAVSAFIADAKNHVYGI